MKFSKELISVLAQKSDLVYESNGGLYASRQEHVDLTPYLNEFAVLLTAFIMRATTGDEEEKLEPVKLADGSVKQSTLKVNGQNYRCACGCNVFHQPDNTQPEIYQCNACNQQCETE